MKINHPSRISSGHDYNRETADRGLVSCILRVPAPGAEYLLEFDLPAYLADKLRTHDWDEMGHQLRVYAARVCAEGALMGATQGMIYTLLQTAARKAIYDRFVAAQLRAGNDAWAVPMTIHGDQYPGMEA